MNQDTKPALASRRAVLRAGLAGGVAALWSPSAAADANPANLPPNVADWTRMLGEGVAARPYGKRAKYEEHIVRRDVSWLTASPQSSVSFTPLHELDGIITPNGLCFRTASFRYRRGQPDRLPADAARPGRQTADLHVRRHQAHAAGQSRAFLRMRGQLRHGMARRAAQRLPVHPRHGALRDVHRRAVEGAAERSRTETQGQVAAARRRRRRGDDALAAA